MGGLSIGHLLVLLVIVLVLMGPQRLEGVGSSLGKAIRGFKKGLDGDEENEKKDSTTDSDKSQKS